MLLKRHATVHVKVRLLRKASVCHRFTGNKEYSRILRASVCLFWGRWFLPVPYKHDIISLVGQPITGGRHSHLHHPLTTPIHRRLLVSTEALDTCTLVVPAASSSSAVTEMCAMERSSSSQPAARLEQE